MITFYNSIYSNTSINTDLPSLLKAIKDGSWKEITEQYRANPDPEMKRNKFPAVTISGIFPDERKAAKLEKHSGFIAIDFDDVEDIDHARSELYADEYTYSGFLSVSGKGLCIIVKIDGSRHLDAFNGLEKYYYKKYGYQIDQSCKDVSRLRFVSYDPDLTLNTESKLFKDYAENKRGRPKKSFNIIAGESDFEFVLQQIEQKKIDLTVSYLDWIEIGMAIKSHFGNTGLDYFKAVSQYHPDYDEVKTERKYNSFKSTGNISISSFFYHAKQAGLQIKTKNTETITMVATYAKKRKAKKEDAIDQLEKVDGIPKEVSSPIVDMVFKSDFKDSDRDTLTYIEEFLRREVQLKFNEITLKYEMNGVPINDRDLNTIYLDCKKVVPEANKDLVMSVIDSDRTPKYNPVHAFFLNHCDRKCKGNIQKLADCIKTNRGNTKYVEYFIRKWLIGSVAMWHKHHSPLMLVLAGFAQNTGKTHFFRYILPNELQPYFAEAELTGDKDENLLMCNKLIILNDEMSNKSRKDIAMVKKLCSAQWFNLRRPYGRLSEDFRRIAALSGTSNDLALLNDPSGNRRIIPFDVASIDHKLYNSIDKVDLWVESYRAFKAGEEFHLNSEDITFLAENTSEFEEPSLEYEGIMAYFEPGTDQELTNTQIKSYIEIRTKQRLSSKKIGMELKKLGFEQVLRYINGVKSRVYGVKEIHGVKVNQFLDDPF
jgi:predicted P-loop ATPase